MIIIIFHIISIFVFICKQSKKLKKIIKDIIFAIKNAKLLDKETKSKGKKSPKIEENINNDINKYKKQKNHLKYLQRTMSSTLLCYDCFLMNCCISMFK